MADQQPDDVGPMSHTPECIPKHTSVRDEQLVTETNECLEGEEICMDGHQNRIRSVERGVDKLRLDVGQAGVGVR